MRIIEEIIKDENIRVVERETPDNFTPTDDKIRENPALAQYESAVVEKGKVYFINFNTQREIRVETPKTFSVLFWKVTLISVNRINADQLKVTYRIE